MKITPELYCAVNPHIGPGLSLEALHDNDDNANQVGERLTTEQKNHHRTRGGRGEGEGDPDSGFSNGTFIFITKVPCRPRFA